MEQWTVRLQNQFIIIIILSTVKMLSLAIYDYNMI